MSRLHDFRGWLGDGLARLDQFRFRSLDKVNNARARAALVVLGTSRRRPPTTLPTAKTAVEHCYRVIGASRLRERPSDLIAVSAAVATWENEGGGLGQPDPQARHAAVERTTGEEPGRAGQATKRVAPSDAPVWMGVAESATVVTLNSTAPCS